MNWFLIYTLIVVGSGLDAWNSFWYFLVKKSDGTPSWESKYFSLWRVSQICRVFTGKAACLTCCLHDRKRKLALSEYFGQYRKCCDSQTIKNRAFPLCKFLAKYHCKMCKCWIKSLMSFPEIQFPQRWRNVNETLEEQMINRMPKKAYMTEFKELASTV